MNPIKQKPAQRETFPVTRWFLFCRIFITALGKTLRPHALARFNRKIGNFARKFYKICDCVKSARLAER